MPDKRLKEETLPVERYFIIDTEIRKGSLPTARKLAEKLGVTERTIYRYIILGPRNKTKKRYRIRCRVCIE